MLNIFGGVIGLHKFYVGKIGTGILPILILASSSLMNFNLLGLSITVSLCVIDFITIISGDFTDSKNKIISWKK